MPSATIKASPAFSHDTLRSKLPHAAAWQALEICGVVTTKVPLEMYPAAVPTTTGTTAAGRVRGRAPATHNLSGGLTDAEGSAKSPGLDVPRRRSGPPALPRS